jgi:hypothetical protein
VPVLGGTTSALDRRLAVFERVVGILFFPREPRRYRRPRSWVCQDGQKGAGNNSVYCDENIDMLYGSLIMYTYQTGPRERIHNRDPEELSVAQRALLFATTVPAHELGPSHP